STSGILEGTAQEQMSAFVASMREIGYKGDLPKSWLEAFFELRKLLEPLVKKSRRRVVIFIDELPCFETAKSGFLRAFSHFWNSWANWESKIMLIVCGSATSWMVDNVINNHGGLYNRLTHQIHLREFTLSETYEYFTSLGYGYSKQMVLQIYMAFGGVPYYLGYFRKGESFAKAVDRLFFDGGVLRDEFDQMFAALFRQPLPYIQVMKFLATKKSGINRKEIGDGLKKIDNGHLTKILNDLEICDFVRKFYTIGRGGKLKSSSCFYQLTDFYTIFYFTFHDKAGSIKNYFQKNIGNSVVSAWFGLSFERVVSAHIDKVKKALGIDKIITQHYTWRGEYDGERVQIDLVIDRADGIIDICEIKYSDTEYRLTQEEYFKIIDRVETFKRVTGTQKTVHPVLVTVFGTNRGEYSGMIDFKIMLKDFM
ncbi:MAG: hypothetical protein II480_05725, partial [Bacteroidales bacterium]|nr:hypothetical protein [Bacteroidales bacterium]